MTRIRHQSTLFATALAVTLLPLSSASAAVDDPAASCSALQGQTIDKKVIGAKTPLRTNGAVIDSAVLTAPDGQGRPELCAVRAHILPIDPATPAINIAVNLPTEWNGRSMHFGGGGFNGVVVTGLGALPGAGGGASTVSPIRPIDRGYVTFGGDSGTAVGANPAGSFGVNDEALANYAGDAVKKTRDTAMAIVQSYYGAAPAQQFFAGGSKGGHEALVAAQRYGTDYDGIIAYYPANQNPAMPISWLAVLQAWNSPGGSLNATEQALLYDSVVAVCDGLDGLEDGVIADVSGCDAAYDVTTLLCPGGVDSGDTCLSEAQIGTIRTASEPYKFAFNLAKGITEIGPYPVLQGAGLDTAPIGSYAYFNTGVFRYFIARDASLDVQTVDYRQWKAPIKKFSLQYDAVDPNLGHFVRGGGKLIIVQGTTDNLVTPAATSWYVDRLAERYGASLWDFARYYIQPGYGHGNGVFNLSYDSLTALEAWVLDGVAPVGQIATDANAATFGRQMPLCDYPTWPQYTGGDPNQATSYTCTA